MTLTMTYSYKLQPITEQIAIISQTLDVCRSVWNFALRQRKDWCASRKSPVNACSIHSCYIISAFVEDINFVNWQRGMLSKHSADAGFGQFVKILEWVCFRRDVYFAKVNKDGTSQTCPNCGAHTGKKTLDIRFHHCNECGYTTTRDVAASQEIRNRGLNALLA